MKTFIQKVMVLSCCVISLHSVAAEQPPVVVEVDVAQRREVAPQTWVSGTVVSKYDSKIASEVRGRITWVAQVGDRIENGGKIATIDDYELKIQEKTRKAEVQRLIEKIQYLQKQEKRLESLVTSSNTSISSLEETSAEKKMAEQELVAARAALEQTLYDIKRCHVLAPFSGVIAAQLQMPGEFAEEGKVLARLVNTSDLEVSAKAPLGVSRFIKRNTKVLVRGEFGEEHTPIRSLVPVGDTRSRMIEVRVVLSSSDWVIGEAVRVSMDNASALSVVAVPRDALVLREDAVYLFKVDDKNIAHKVSVKTGQGKGKQVFVEGDVYQDDKVIIRGAERLKDGQSVRVIGKSFATTF